MVDADLTADLRRSLDSFDGNAVSMLSEIRARFGTSTDFKPALIGLFAETEGHISRGATWIWLDHLKAGGTATREDWAAINDQLDQITDWQAVLHVLQSVDFLTELPANTRALSAFASRHLSHKRPFVRAWALNALCRLAALDPSLTAEAIQAHADALNDPAASVRARARNLTLPTE